jgi:diacylglycerol kinase
MRVDIILACFCELILSAVNRVELVKDIHHHAFCFKNVAAYAVLIEIELSVIVIAYLR